MASPPTALPRQHRHGMPVTTTMGASASTELERTMRVRIHITPGQRRALIAVLDRSPEPGVRVADFTAQFDLADPRGWLDARMAEWPRGEFPRASLHGVARKLSAAIRGQVQPDPAQEAEA